MHEVVPDVFWIGFYGGGINVYLIRRDDAFILVDTGASPESITTVEHRLKKIGRSLQNISHVLITHAHFDHTGGLASLQRQCDAQTVAHRREAYIIRGEQPVALAPKRDLYGISWLIRMVMRHDAGEAAEVNIVVENGQQCDDILPGLQVVELLGHSYGHVGYYWPERRILFGGDVMMHMPWGLTLPPRPASPDWDACKASVLHTATMEIDTLLLGHGRPIKKNASEKIRAFAAKLK